MRGKRQIFLAQAFALAVANIKARYRKTFIGFLWVLLNPLIFFGAQCYVFRSILHVPSANYGLFLLSGVAPWIFLSQTLEMGTPSLMDYRLMIKAFPAHPLVYLCAQVLDNLINFLALLLLFLAFVLVRRQIGVLELAILPFPIITLVAGAFGIVWTLATLQVFFRDVRFVLSFVLRILFFVTPIFYPRELVPAKFQWTVDLNPVFALIHPFQELLLQKGAESVLHAELIAMSAAGLLIALGLVTWKTTARSFHLHV